MKLISIVLLFLSLNVQGQDLEPIDSLYEACLDTAMGSYNRYLCTEMANDLWDDELNKNYKLCMRELNEEEKTQLRDAQRLWIKYRDSEVSLFSMVVSGVPGTYYRDAPIVLMQLTRERALKLEGYLELLKERGKY